MDSEGWNDEICTLDQTCVTETTDGYKTSISAPSALFKFIIGKKGETKNRLEIETRTKIRIPRQGQEGDIGRSVLINPFPNKPLFFFVCVCLQYKSLENSV